MISYRRNGHSASPAGSTQGIRPGSRWTFAGSSMPFGTASRISSSINTSQQIPESDRGGTRMPRSMVPFCSFSSRSLVRPSTISTVTWGYFR